MNHTSLCVDFGSAFTKVAFRPNRSETSRLHHNWEEAIESPEDPLNAEARVCIPTVAGYRPSTKRWGFGIDLFGLDPAETAQEEDLEIYWNWKTDLFRRYNPRLRRWLGQPKTVPYDGLSAEKAWEVAVRYFQWLNEVVIFNLQKDLRRTGTPPVIRVCIPEFAIGGKSAEGMNGHLFLRILREAGWNYEKVQFVSEPTANIVGVLTEGRNITYEFPHDSPLHGELDGGPAYSEMFAESGVARDSAAGDYIFVVVDIGAYTSDFAATRIREGAFGAGSFQMSHSAELGVAYLDKRVRDRVLEPAGKAEAFRSMSPSEREAFHLRVYGHRSEYSVGGERIGHGEEMDLIQKQVSQFAAEIGEELKAFLRRHGLRKVNEAIFTGGGSKIPGLSAGILDSLTAHGVQVLHTQMAPEELPDDLHVHQLGQHLIRGGSAIGGTSIVFDGDH